MGSYNTLKDTITTEVYNNTQGDVTGASLQALLISIVNIVGTNAGLMGLLGSGNMPSTEYDNKQFYIASTAGAYDLSAVGLGTLNVTSGDIYVVYSDATGWHSVNIANGISGSLTALGNTVSLVSDDVEGTKKMLAMSNGVLVHATESGTIAVTAGGVASVIYNASEDKLGEPSTGLVDISASTDDIYILFSDNRLDSGFLSNCYDVTLPSNITDIGNLFSGDTDVNAITFRSAAVPKMDSDCFMGCTVAGVYVPDCSSVKYTTILGGAGLSETGNIHSIEDSY